MPEPDAKSNWIYRWLYTALHAIGANWDKVQAARKADPAADLEPIAEAALKVFRETPRPIQRE